MRRGTDPIKTPERTAFVDDAIYEINQRWGKPFGGDMWEMDHVGETAEAVLAPALAEVERLRKALNEIAFLASYGVAADADEGINLAGMLGRIARCAADAEAKDG